MAGKNSGEIRCSFCNKTQDQVKKLIAGPNGTYICDECVSVCEEILNEEFDDFKLVGPGFEQNIGLGHGGSRRRQKVGGYLSTIDKTREPVNQIRPGPERPWLTAA